MREEIRKVTLDINSFPHLPPLQLNFTQCDTVEAHATAGVEQNGYVVEHSRSKGQITVRRFNLKGLYQSHNCIVSDEDP